MVKFAPMDPTFRDALMWHMTRNGTKVADLARGSGVTRDAINKVLRRPGASTSVENGLRIARYYRLPLEAFMRCEAADSGIERLAGLLTSEERAVLLAQIEGLVARHATRPR